MYYITDCYTDEIIDVSESILGAIAICKANPDSQVEDEQDEIIFVNMEG